MLLIVCLRISLLPFLIAPPACPKARCGWRSGHLQAVGLAQFLKYLHLLDPTQIG
eukprot:UN18207